MGASGLLRERDLRLLTAVVEDGLRDDPGPAMPWAVLDRLHQLIPCDGVQFDEIEPQERRTHGGQIVEDGGERTGLDGDVDGDHAFWALRGMFRPNAYTARVGDVVSVLRWSDFYTSAELKSAAFYAECLDPSLKYCLFLPLPAAPGRTRRLGFFRSTGDFGERDRLALQLLRPHLHEVYLDAERRRRGIPHLSPREREVLRLASQGWSNADIAATLFISVATVRKHMEHVFDRTGVRNRAAAAALAFPSSGGFRPGPALEDDTGL